MAEFQRFMIRALRQSMCVASPIGDMGLFLEVVAEVRPAAVNLLHNTQRGRSRSMA